MLLTLSNVNTLSKLKILCLVCLKIKKNIGKEQESKIKALILKLKLST